MNAPAKIDIGEGYDTLGAAMQAEGLYQVRWHRNFRHFTVELESGQIGGGKTIREAIENAHTDRRAA